MGVPENIKFLILKWRQRRLSETEQAELDAWYDAPLPEVVYIEGDSEEQTREKMLNRIQREMGDEHNKVVPLWPVWFRVAAAVVVILGLSLFFAQYRSKITDDRSNIQAVTSQDAIKKIILPDSSIVWLKKNSRFSYPKTFGKGTRDVVLTGEAFFEIAHHKRWPFRIKSDNYTTTVLGTSFNLKTGNKNEGYAISVLTGKVEVAKKEAFKTATIYFVSANQSYHAEAGRVEAILPADKDKQVKELIKGTEYDMAFDKVPFELIMSRFEQKFNVHFEGYTGEYNSCVVTADLTNLSLEKSLQILCSSVNATYKVDHDKIKLTGGGCF